LISIMFDSFRRRGCFDLRLAERISYISHIRTSKLMLLIILIECAYGGVVGVISTARPMLSCRMRK